MGVVGTAWALDAVTGAPSYTGRVLRQTHSPTLAGATTARPFGGISGVRPGTSASTVTSTSTTWTAQTFAGVIDLEASALSGAYGFAFNLVTSGAVTASNASNPRIDILSVRIDDPAEGDGTAVPAVTMVYTAGTAAASPTVPASPARSFIVAQLTFPAGVGTTPTVTWAPPYTVGAGGVLPVPTLALLNAITGTSGQQAVVYADTTVANNGDYDWITSAWVRTWSPAANAFAESAGVITAAANTTGNTTVTFPTGRFTVAPIVSVVTTNVIANVAMNALTITSTGFTLQTYNVSTGAAISGVGTQWTARQMTSTTAAG